MAHPSNDIKGMLKKVFGDAQGPLGFPMRSDDAREVERIMGERPSEVRSYGLQRMTCISKAQQTFEEGERADVSMVTASGMDRDREVVLARGIDWSQFKKSPVVTFAHMYDCLPVGKCLWLKADKTKSGEDGWIAKTRYSPRPEADLWPAGEPWFPDAVFSLVKSGDLRGKSIGFIPMSARAPTDKEKSADPSMENCRVVFDKVLAIEYAVAPVQSNPDALVQTVSKCRADGQTMPDELLEALGLVLPCDVEELTPTQKEAPRPVKKGVDRARVMSLVERRLRGITPESVAEEVMNRKKGRL